MKRPRPCAQFNRCAAASILLIAVAAAVAMSVRALSAQELTRRPAGGSLGPVSGLHGVLTKAQLSPPLQGRLRAIRYSPDGHYILVQDESAVYVIRRSPIAVLFAFPARLALPVRFTADSSGIVLATRNRQAQKWSVEQGQPGDAKQFGQGEDCYLATLSPHGDLYACLGLQSDVHVFDVDSKQEVFTGHLGDSPSENLHAVLPFHAGLARSEPFGYFVGGLSTLLPFTSTLSSSNLKFSPSGRFLLAVDLFRGAFAFDLAQKRKISLGGSLRHAVEHGGFQFVADDRVAFVSPDKAGDSGLLSFPSGADLGKLNVSGAAEATGNPEYLIHISEDGQTAKLLDLQTKAENFQISNGGGDVFQDEVASYAADTGLTISKIGAEHPEIRGRVPAGPIPALLTALASPDLQTIVLSVRGQGAAFRISDGKRIATFPSVRGAWFDGDQHAYLRIQVGQSESTNMETLNPTTGSSQVAWPIEEVPIRKQSLVSGPIVLSESIDELYLNFNGKRFGYKLRALDFKTGNTLWTHDYGSEPSHYNFEDPALTFTNPQGETVVLGWEATLDAAKQAAKHEPAAQQAMKHAKVTDRDTVFEVLDARTGNIQHVAFVPGGSGPQGYTSAFSDGDWLVAVKDEMRITAVSLSKGDERLRVTGRDPAVSGAADLLAASDDGGRLSLYDLKTGRRRDVFQLPADVAYLRFSGDGKRLLALTQEQIVYVLDVSAPPAAAPAASP
jgi:WD40 repeat protein